MIWNLDRSQLSSAVLKSFINAFICSVKSSSGRIFAGWEDDPVPCSLFGLMAASVEGSSPIVVVIVVMEFLVIVVMGFLVIVVMGLLVFVMMGFLLRNTFIFSVKSICFCQFWTEDSPSLPMVCLTGSVIVRSDLQILNRRQATN